MTKQGHRSEKHGTEIRNRYNAREDEYRIERSELEEQTHKKEEKELEEYSKKQKR